MSVVMIPSTEPFETALESGKFLVTSEADPPKGTDLTAFTRDVELLKDRVDAINITDHQSSVMRFPSLGGALLVAEAGGEPILQMTCRDRNRLALQADLMFAYSRGIKNVLCLTGDSVYVGDHKGAKGVFDLDSAQLLHAIKTLQPAKGIEIAGRMIRQIRDEKICDGVHVMAIGKEELVPEILDAAAG